MVLLIPLMKKDRSWSNKYDERQRIAQGNGYRIGFWFLFACCMVYAFLEACDITLSVTAGMFLFLAAMLAVMIYSIYCIHTEAYYAVNDNKGRWSITFLVIMAANLVLGIVGLLSGQVKFDGRIHFDGFLNLVCGGMLVIVFFALLLHRIFTEKKEEQEE